MKAYQRTRTITCLCGNTAQDISLDPLVEHSTLDLCHCNDCRAITGMMYSSYYFLQTPEPKFDALQKYQQADCISRYFCRTCGAHVFAHLEASGKTLVASGVLSDKPPPIEMIRHWKIEDTHDGGIRSFLPDGAEETASSCWLATIQNPAQETIGNNDNGPQEKDHKWNRLQARCHCGGVDFRITPPDAKSAQPWSPWPDLLVPYHLKSAKNIKDAKWWLRDGNTRYLAGTCACRSCRLASGFPIQSWAFIPKANILAADGEPLEFGKGTMQQYESLPGVYRQFCNRCGATVFWHCQERPQIIDVSVGLLRAKSGTRAEEWLDWASDRVSFKEMALDRDFIELLEGGLKAWGGCKQIPNH